MLPKGSHTCLKVWAVVGSFFDSRHLRAPTGADVHRGGVLFISGFNVYNVGANKLAWINLVLKLTIIKSSENFWASEGISPSKILACSKRTLLRAFCTFADFFGNTISAWLVLISSTFLVPSYSGFGPLKFFLNWNLNHPRRLQVLRDYQLDLLTQQHLQPIPLCGFN